MTEYKWSVRSYNDDDFEQISRFREMFLDNSNRRSSAPTYYKWKILENPFQEGILYVAHKRNQIIGMVSITPKLIFINNKLTKCGELGDGFVDPNYQGQGIFFELLNYTRKVAIEKGIDFIYGTPNEVALPVERKAGYEIIPAVQVCNLVYPINIASILADKFGSQRLAKILCSIMSRVYGFLYNISPSQFDKKEAQFSIISKFPEDIEQFHLDTSAKYDWILERKRKYLDWRYLQNPDEYSIWLARIQERTIGYAVTKIGKWKDFKVGYLADFLTDEKEPEIFVELLLRSFSSLKSQNADMIATWVVKDSFYFKILKKLGFKLFKIMPIICYKNDFGLNILNSRGRWHFTMADSDNI